MSVIELENNLVLNLYQKAESKDIKLCAEQAHGQLVLDFIYTYFKERNIPNAETLVQDYFITNNYVPQYQPLFCAEEIPNICEQLQITYLNSDFKIKNQKLIRGISKENMIAKGAVYTQNPIVEYIVTNTLKNVELTPTIKVLDFACGTGRFYEELARQLTKAGISQETVVTQCVEANDINPVAVNITRLKACALLDTITQHHLQAITKRIRCENALMPPLKEIGLFATDDKDTKYDAIVSNPPYLVLKPSHKTSEELAEQMRLQVEYYRKSKQYLYSLEGMLNLYQLSIERMLQMLKPHGELGVICPSTLFADQSATNLRKHLLMRNKVRHITYYPEKTELFENNVTQATNIFFLQKNGETTDISITTNNKSFVVSLELIKELFPQNMEIPLISDKDWKILRKINKFPRLKTYKTIRNKRGELDLTLNSKYITTTPTRHLLIRGKMITDRGVTRTAQEYVEEGFVSTKSSDYRQKDFGKVRLIGQNICNIDNSQRLHFAFCEPNDILGNSCNYLSSDIDTLKKLYILLSSALLNWRFRLTSSNNHINNYELDELPIVDLNTIDGNAQFPNAQEKNSFVCSLYGLNKTETEYICSL